MDDSITLIILSNFTLCHTIFDIAIYIASHTFIYIYTHSTRNGSLQQQQIRAEKKLH